MAKRKQINTKLIIALIIVAIIIAGVAFYLYKYQRATFDKIYDIIFPKEEERQSEKYTAASSERLETSLSGSGSLEIHFIELGNQFAGDCIYVKAGDNDILIDAGSRVDSVSTISSYLNKYVEDNELEYVIVTHAHQDHYAGFATNTKTDSIFDLYVCDTIIDFALTNQKETATQYGNYKRELADEVANGATHLTARECIEKNKDVYDLGDGITMRVLDSYYYYNTSSTENDYSVCLLFTQGERNFLFTGDLEAEGEKKLTEMNDLPEVVLYKAGHHGSKTSSSEELLSVIKPEVICVCASAGGDEYKAKPENTFPTQTFVNTVAKYTERVYVTTLFVPNGEGSEDDSFESYNGCIVIVSDSSGIVMNFSNNNTRLKDSEWFKQNRDCPAAWK